jgi:hypothetical protein
MQDTVPIGLGNRYGLGLLRTRNFAFLAPRPIPCGVVWGHNGDIIGYHSNAFASLDGSRQAVVLANLDADNTSAAANDALYEVLRLGVCG